MKALKLFAGLVALLLTLPIWFYLLYQVLVRVQASELMWFLFWIYVPATILATVAARIATHDD